MRPPLDPQDIGRALFVRMRRLGDTLLMAPALAAFRAWAPRVRIAVVVREGYQPVAAALAEVDELVVVDAGLLGLVRAARACRRFRPDLVVDYHGSWCAAAIVAASGARLSVGEARFRWPAYAVRVPRTEHLFGLTRRAHTVENHLAPLAAIGVPTAGARFSLPVDRRAAAAVEDRLRRVGTPAGPRVVLFPTTTRRSKQWPLPRWHRLADQLAAAWPGPVVLVFAPGEGVITAPARRGHAYHAVEGLPFAELSALVASSALVVAHDSLGAHLAAAHGVRSVVLFGATDPARYHPWQGDAAVLRVDGLCCSPCGGAACRSPYYPWACLEGLDPDVVLEAVLARLPAEAALAARA